MKNCVLLGYKFALTLPEDICTKSELSKALSITRPDDYYFFFLTLGGKVIVI